MATRTGAVGSNNNTTQFLNPVSIGVTMAAGEYPNGTITFTDIGPNRAGWFNQHFQMALGVKLYLCDSNGNNRVQIGSQFTINVQNYNYTNTFAVSGATALAGKALYLVMESTRQDLQTPLYTVLRNRTSISIPTAYNTFAITCASNGNGTLTANVNSATPGATVTLTPSPNTGYELSSYTSSPSVTITNNKFTMPQSAVTITATFAKKNYTITTKASPAAGGTVTAGSATAKMGASVSISQTENDGYYFDKWTSSPTVTISSGAFTMPAANVTITANYLKRSTGTLSKKTFSGGETITLTISADKATYSHWYRVVFSGAMAETNWHTVTAGKTTVSVRIPEWDSHLTNATSLTGGKIELRTYNGSELIGTYNITGCKYTIPSSVVPTIGTITKSIARTINGTTYANVGEYYVQNHCGVRIQTTAAGANGSTIESLKVSLAGYSGNKYNKTVYTTSIDFTTGLLSTAGKTTITVTATDSRGRTATKTATFTVTAYNAPDGTLEVKRVNNAGQDDDMGTYGKYELTKTWTEIGSNSLTVTMTGGGGTKTISTDTGDILPGSRKTFNIQQEYTITVTLADAFETVTITAKLRSAKFIIYVNAGGNKLGFMKATNKGGDNDTTIEFSGDATIYIGDQTLENYIRSIVNNM